MQHVARTVQVALQRPCNDAAWWWINLAAVQPHRAGWADRWEVDRIVHHRAVHINCLALCVHATSKGRQSRGVDAVKRTGHHIGRNGSFGSQQVGAHSGNDIGLVAVAINDIGARLQRHILALDQAHADLARFDNQHIAVFGICADRAADSVGCVIQGHIAASAVDRCVAHNIERRGLRHVAACVDRQVTARSRYIGQIQRICISNHNRLGGATEGRDIVTRIAQHDSARSGRHTQCRRLDGGSLSDVFGRSVQVDGVGCDTHYTLHRADSQAVSVSVGNRDAAAWLVHRVGSDRVACVGHHDIARTRQRQA